MFKEIFDIHCPYSEVITQVVCLLPLGVHIDEYLADVSDYTLSGFSYWETSYCSLAHVDKISLAKKIISLIMILQTTLIHDTGFNNTF